jgi:hypothetical protein
MNKILKQLQKQRENLVSESQKRDEYYTKRKEQWQNTASGTLYECRTSKIAQVIVKLDNTISEFKKLLNDC